MNLSEKHWKKSSFSNGQGGECVEVGYSVTEIGIRDTKNRDGGMLVVSREVFSAFLKKIRDTH